MAGFRTFATGEVLTAANVNNFLMKQSVMVFADADARTAALGTDVVEGMLTYNEDTAQLEVFDGAAFVLAAPAPPAGIGSNVVQAVRTTLFTTSSTSFVDVTDVEVTITPTTATSKVLILFTTSTAIDNAGDLTAMFELRRDSTSVGIGTDSNPASVALSNGEQGGVGQVRKTGFPTQFMFLDSPTSTSATTYKMRVRTSSGAVRVGNVRSDGSSSVPTVLIAIEVAA